MAMRFEHLYIPSRGFGKELYESLLHPLQKISHESPAYLGIGIIIALATILIWKIPVIAKWIKNSAKTPIFWILLILIIILHESKGHWKDYTCWLGAGVIVLILGLYIKGMVHRSRKSPIMLAIAFLVFTAILTYGIASGPRSLFMYQKINPSIWGVFSFLIPGISNMRSVGRLAVVGQGIIFSILIFTLFWLIAQLRENGRRKLIVMTMILISLQFVDQLKVQGRINYYTTEGVTPTLDERKFYSSISGPIAVFPTNPYHRNTYPMLYFNHFSEIYLMNGYSSRSTPLWDHVMMLGREGNEPTEKQLQYVEEKGCKYLIIWKKSRNAYIGTELKNGDRPVLYENDRVLVLAAANNLSLSKINPSPK